MMRPLAAALALLAASPAFAGDEEYYPVALGNAWEYTDGLNTWITTIEAVSGNDFVTATRMNGELVSRTVFRRDKEGIKEVAYENQKGAGKHAKPLLVLRFPIKAGDAWKGSFTVGGARYTTVTVVKGPQQIRVPAGTFTAIVYVSTAETYGMTMVTTTWFVKGIGVVRMNVASRMSGQPMELDYRLVKAGVRKAAARCGGCGAKFEADEDECGECGAKRRPRRRTEQEED